MSKNTQEYRAIIRATEVLAHAVKDNITRLSLKLVSKQLITTDFQRALRNPNKDLLERASDLVTFMIDKVEQDPKNYYDFVKILLEDRTIYREVLEKLELPEDTQTTGTLRFHKFNRL